MEESFIAYLGSEISESEIESALEDVQKGNSTTVKTKSCAGEQVIFGKIINDSYEDDRDPNCKDDIFVVSGCDRDEINDLAEDRYSRFNIDDYDRNWLVFKELYSEKKLEMFSELEEELDYAVAIYDCNEKKLVVGRGNGEMGKEANLFYGFTRRKGDMIFSNNKKLLLKFCDEAIEFPKNSYYANGEFHTYKKGQEQTMSADPRLIKNNQSNAHAIIEGLNALLISVTDESVKKKIEENIERYLKSSDPKKKIEDYLLQEIDRETQKVVLQLIKDSISSMGLSRQIEKELRRYYRKALSEFIKTQPVPYVNVIQLRDTELGRTNVECFHEKFEEVLQLVQLDEPIMLIGPAGSGKNHSIAQIAQALGMKMYYTNNASNEFKLTGFIDAGGNYRDTEFYKAFKNGGIFFLDEIDNSDPSALIVINSALANDYMAFPHETIDRHPDFRMVAAANTWGKGSDLQYVGRNALDGATLDRFDNIFFDYDRRLEQALYPNEQVLDFMWSFRDGVEKTKTPHIVSTRGIGKVYKKEINGIPVETILRANIIRNLGQDDLNTILGNMENINSNNKYYSAAKTLKLGK